MISTKTLVLLIGAIASGTVMAAPMEAPAPAPPLVKASPGLDAVPNTVPTQLPETQDASAPGMIEGTYIQFWKDPNFRGQTISTILDRGQGACYSFRGDSWSQWNKAISSLNILEGGPCWLYEGSSCSVSSIGPIRTGNPIPDLGVYGWAKKAGSISCST
ncbi:hypothetical protein RB594_003407 [Gaeumannomyces avenae]